MYLTEVKVIRDKGFYKEIDGYCEKCKNLYNLTNYTINQIYRIACKMAKDEELEDWEGAFIENVNEGIDIYNKGGRTEKHVKHISKDRKTMTDFYFVNWYMRGATYFYDTLPLITSGQRVIEELCNAWKGYYSLLDRYNQGKIKNKPNKPGYKDKKNGRADFVITKAHFKQIGNKLILSKRLNNYVIRTNKTNIQQIRLITEKGYVKAKIVYKVADKELKRDNGRYYSIDLGINNLMAVVSNIKGINPIIINGKPLKSVNQYYHKEFARLQSICNTVNNLETTKRLSQLTDKRNRKINDYMHKVSRIVIEKAKEDNISKIVVGKNTNWKQRMLMGKKGNQNFSFIPYNKLINMLRYKGQIEGIEVIEVEERYTSGTSYIDEEFPCKDNYDKTRRVHRGLFRTNKGITINADVNGAYQILKKADLVGYLGYKGAERVEKVRKTA